jgi:hypothetical protein
MTTEIEHPEIRHVVYSIRRTDGTLNGKPPLPWRKAVGHSDTGDRRADADLESMYYVRQEARPVALRFATRQSGRAFGLALAVRSAGLAGFQRSRIITVIAYVSGNVVECSCFRILAVNSGALSTDVHGRMPLSRSVVTRLVTHIGTRVVRCGLASRRPVVADKRPKTFPEGPKWAPLQPVVRSCCPAKVRACGAAADSLPR